jgi:hypothetical protein
MLFQFGFLFVIVGYFSQVIYTVYFAVKVSEEINRSAVQDLSNALCALFSGCG